MKVIFLKLMHCLALILTLVIILLALLICIIKAEAPVVAQEVPNIEAYFSQRLNHPVEIQSALLKWRGIMPVLDITHLVIYSTDKTQKIFALDELSLGARFFPSLWHRELLLKYFYMNGLNLTLERDKKSGKWQVQGLAGLINIPETTSSSNSSVRKSFKLEGKNLSLNILGVFPKVITIQNFNARLIVEQGAQGPKITLSKIQADNQDAKVNGNVIYNNDTINLRLEYQLFPSMASCVDHYLPQNLLHPELITWLKHSIQELSSGTGIFILEGNLEDFPYTHKPGEFLVDTNLKGLVLKYDPAWPVAQNLEGELVFHDDAMELHVNSVKIDGVTVNHLEADIPSLGAESVLNIQGRVLTTSQDLLTFVNHTPLKKTLGKYFQGYQWAGPAQLQLKLTIPLTPQAKPSTTSVLGVIYLNQNKLIISPEIALEKFNAEIHFNESGITGKSLNGRVGNIPLNASILSKQFIIDYKKWHLIFNKQNNNNWTANISYPGLSGILVLQNGFPPSRISGQFKNITVTGENPSADFKQTIKPQKIPPLNMIINDFRYQDKFFGKVNFKTSPIKNGLRLENLQSVIGATNILLNGQWTQNIKGTGSAISGNFNSQNMAETLKQWGLSPSIESQSVVSHYNFTWPGSLYLPDIKNLGGNINFKIGKGQILNVGSQAKMDIGRLLTLLSFQSLAKRLTLDFSDIAMKGLNFDSITGDFQLNQGIATTQNTRLKGPISSILMTGSINLVNKTYQLKLLVTPHLTSSLPIIATIAGGPIVGAATWAADKLFNPILNKITSDTYTITGPWDKPVIK